MIRVVSSPLFLTWHHHFYETSKFWNCLYLLFAPILAEYFNFRKKFPQSISMIFSCCFCKSEHRNFLTSCVQAWRHRFRPSFHFSSVNLRSAALTAPSAWLDWPVSLPRVRRAERSGRYPWRASVLTQIGYSLAKQATAWHCPLKSPHSKAIKTTDCNT